MIPVSIHLTDGGRLRLRVDDGDDYHSIDLGPALDVDLDDVPESLRAQAEWLIDAQRDAIPSDEYRRQVERDYDSTRGSRW